MVFDSLRWLYVSPLRMWRLFRVLRRLQNVSVAKILASLKAGMCPVHVCRNEWPKLTDHSDYGLSLCRCYAELIFFWVDSSFVQHTIISMDHLLYRCMESLHRSILVFSWLSESSSMVLPTLGLFPLSQSEFPYWEYPTLFCRMLNSDVLLAVDSWVEVPSVYFYCSLSFFLFVFCFFFVIFQQQVASTQSLAKVIRIQKCLYGTMNIERCQRCH